MTSSVNSDKKPHPLTAIQAKTTTTATTLPHNLKFQQQPKNFKLAKTLKENVDTTTTTTATTATTTASSTASAQTSSHLKSKGNDNRNTFFKIEDWYSSSGKDSRVIFISLDFFFIFMPKETVSVGHILNWSFLKNSYRRESDFIHNIVPYRTLPFSVRPIFITIAVSRREACRIFGLIFSVFR